MNRRKLVDNKWVTILEDKYELSNGAECTYYHAQKTDAVLTIAIEYVGSKTYTHIVNQYRLPIEQTIWQFPIGGFDSSTEDAKAVARMELQEETGVLVGDIEYLGSIYADPGFTNQKLHVCASRDIVEIGEQRLERTEHGLVCKRVATSDIKKLIDSGEMGDAWGLAGYYYMSSFLNGPNERES